MFIRKLTILALTALLLSSCGLRLRGPQDFPAVLKRMNFCSDNVYQNISSSLTRLLRASQVKLNTGNTPITLILKNSHFHTAVPAVFSTLTANTYTYRLSVTLILTVNHKEINNTVISATKSVAYNVNQVGTPVTTSLMRRRLTEAVVQQVYNYLNSKGLQQTIIKTLAKRHKQ